MEDYKSRVLGGYGQQTLPLLHPAALRRLGASSRGLGHRQVREARRGTSGSRLGALWRAKRARTTASLGDLFVVGLVVGFPFNPQVKALLLGPPAR